MIENTSKTILDKSNSENKKYLFLLLPIGILSYLIKTYYFEPGIPLTFDSLSYFFYAVDITVLGHLPENYSLANNTWSIFLSLFFQLFQFDNVIQYMDLQKNLSMILSTLTIIPIYFLSRKFFDPKYSIIASFIFALEPRIIQNSLLGIIEPLYILLGTVTLLFFLSSNKKFVYLSFLFAALTSLTRGEGQMLFIIISIVFFVRFRKDKMVIPKFLIGLSIFILILTPMTFYQMEVLEQDAIFGRASNTISYHIQDPSKTDGGSGLPFLISGVENFVKFFIWDLVPIFIFFVPVGIFYLFKKCDYRKLTLIISGVGISIPAFYAYSIPLLDTRYLFMLYPIFCIISIFAIKKFSSYFKTNNIIIGLILIGILFSSLIFLELKSTENLQTYEIVQITKEIIKKPKVINSFYPEHHYLEPVMLPEKWNDFKNVFLKERIKGESIRNSILSPIKIISIERYDSIEEFVKQNSDLTHIYVDQNENRPMFLKNIYQNENQYKFLIKEFDSKDHGYNYHVKIFRINR